MVPKQTKIPRNNSPNAQLGILLNSIIKIQILIDPLAFFSNPGPQVETEVSAAEKLLLEKTSSRDITAISELRFGSDKISGD